MTSEDPPARPVRRLALIGAALALAALLIPLTLDYRSLVWSWQLLGLGGSAASDTAPAPSRLLWLALLWPIVAVGVGAIVFAVPRLGERVRAGALVVVGGIGLFATLSPLGRTCAGPEALSPLLLLALALSGAAAAVRLAHPLASGPRYALLLAPLLLLAGLAIPVGDAGAALPGELALYLPPRALADAAPIAVLLDGAGRDVMVRFLSVWHLLPILLLPAAAALAWRWPAPPSEAAADDDLAAQTLRPLVWAITLYLPASYLLYAANIRGFTGAEWVRYRDHVAPFDDFVRTATWGRLHASAAAAAYALWLQRGLLLLRR